MLDDTRQETLQSPRRGIGLMGLRLLPIIAVLTSTDLAVAHEPGVAVVDGKVQEFAGDGDLPCYAGETLADGSSVTCAVVATYSPLTDRISILVVDGTAATTGSQVAPTDAQIEAALADDANPYTLLGTVTFSRSGTVVTCSIDHTARSFGVATDGKACAAAAAEDWADSTLFEHAVTQAFSVDAADIANGDVVTEHPVPAFHGKIGAWRAVCEKAISTDAKTATLNLEIGTTNVAGTSTAYAGTKALGVVTALTAPTAGSATAEFAPGDTFSIEASSVTAFVEGRVRIEVDFYRKVA